MSRKNAHTLIKHILLVKVPTTIICDCYKNGTDILVQHRIARNLYSLKNAMSAKHNKMKCIKMRYNKMRYDYINNF